MPSTGAGRRSGHLLDKAVRGTAGQETRRVSSKAFVRELAAERKGEPGTAGGPGRSQIEDAIDEATCESPSVFAGVVEVSRAPCYDRDLNPEG